MKRTLPDKLKLAISKIFENPEIGYTELGCSAEGEICSLGLKTQNDVTKSIDALERVALLRRRLENWVEFKAVEIDEFDNSDEALRIQYEVLTPLLVLRDLSQFFPEVETASKLDLEKLERTL